MDVARRGAEGEPERECEGGYGYDGGDEVG